MDLDEDVKMGGFGESTIVSSSIVHGSVVNTHTVATQDHNRQTESATFDTTQILGQPASAFRSFEDTLEDPKADTSMNDFMSNSLDIQMDGSITESGQDAIVTGLNTGFDTPIADTSDSSPQRIEKDDSTSPRLGLVDASAEFQNDEEGLAHSYSSNTTADRALTQDTSPEPSVVVVRAPDAKLPYSSRRTGLVYDPRMRFHTELGATEDDIHPEDPRRIWEIFQELRHEGLVEDDDDERIQVNGDSDGYKPQRLLKIDARLAEAAEVCLVHTEAHWKWVEELETYTEGSLKAIGKSMDSVYLHPMTHFCARLSAGGCIEAARAVVTGIVKNAIAVIRPPGHHAEHNEPGGFCFFNNVCVATRVVQNDFPDLCRKVLILDWDVHHGNGIQNIFENDPNVLYISLHVHKDGKFYPNGPAGDHLHVGTGAGEGRNINIPWPQHHMRDGDYLYAFQQIVMPVAQEFNPDLVVIAAGFDAAEGDQLGMCHVSPEGFAHMTHMLMSLANGRVLAALEGGYNLRSIAKSAAAVTKTLMGEPPGRIADLEPSLAGVATVKVVIDQQSKYWKCLFPKETPEARVKRMRGERLHDIYRENQKMRWFNKFGMSPLCINRDKLSRSFEDQVLATGDFTDSKPLLIIFHDPPEIMNLPDSDSTTLEPHNIVINDVAQEYVRQAIESGFSVIDVNVPAHLTSLDDGTNSGDYRVSVTNEVATYIWENYVEVNNHSHIFLLGIGSAAFAMIHILNSHESTNESVSLAASFVAQNILQGVSRPADDFFPAWYWNHSIVWVAENHGVWSPDRQRKLRKKYGKLVKSSQTSVNDMLAQHQKEFFGKLAEQMAPPPEMYRGAASQVLTKEPAQIITNPLGLISAPGLIVNGVIGRGDETDYAADTSSMGGADVGNALMEGVLGMSGVPLKSPSPTLRQEIAIPPPFANLQAPMGSPSTMDASPIRSPVHNAYSPAMGTYQDFQSLQPSMDDFRNS